MMMKYESGIQSRYTPIDRGLTRSIIINLRHISVIFTHIRWPCMYMELTKAKINNLVPEHYIIIPYTDKQTIEPKQE